MSVKALGIALKLTFEGTNQLVYSQTWVFAVVVISCILMQMNYLNKVKVSKEMCKCFNFRSRTGQKLLILVCLLQALDTFNTAVVSPIYYVMFTSLTILASVIMFKVCILK